MQAFPCKGVGVALVTPFKNGKIDFNALQGLIEHTLQGGVDFLVALGTTGETTSLSSDEQRAVLDCIIATAAGRVPVVAGPFGLNNTEELVHKLRHFNYDGISALMASSPAYVKPNQEGIYQHYMAMAAASPLPIIIYNVPGRTSSNLTAATTTRLAHASDKFIAVKEASDDLMQIMSIIKNKPARFNVVSGDDYLTLPIIASGGCGVISVISNALPAPFCALTHAAQAGDLATAQYYNNLLLDIHSLLFVDGNPVGVKTALAILGICSSEVRLPHAPMQASNRALLEKQIDALTALRV